MDLNLKKDMRAIARHLKKRAAEYPEYVNEGPGRDEDTITQITLGFEYDQAGWVALIFDTRPEAEVDGEWNGYIEENAFELPHWTEALYDHEGAVRVTLPSSKTKKLSASRDEEATAKLLGEALRDALVQARDKGVFKKLPLADGCRFTVEHQEGAWGWSEGEDPEDAQERLYEESMARVAKLPKKKQVEYWAQELDRLASGKPCELSRIGVDPKVPYLAFEGLEGLEEELAVPLLKLARKWSAKPEWIGDRPQKTIEEAPHAGIVFSALELVEDAGVATPEVEKLLVEIVRRGIKANAGRKLWGTTPYHAAQCLHELFDGYPEPKKGDSNNELRKPEAFLKKG